MPIKESSYSIKINKNIAWMFFDKFYTKLIVFAVGIYVAKYLGAKNYGVLQYYYSLVLLIKPLANLGLENIIIKKIVEKKFPMKDTLETGFILKLISSTILLLIFIFYSLVKLENSNVIIFNTLLLILLFQSFNVFECFFQSIIKSKYSVVARIVAITISGSIKVILVLLNSPIHYFAVAILIEHILVGIIQYVIFIRLNGGLKYRLNHSIAKELLAESWWLILAGIPAVIYLRIDQVMLGKMSTMEETGLYSLAVKFSEVFYFAPVIIVSSILPLLIRNFKSNINSFYLVIEYYIKSVTFLSIFITSMALLLNEKIFYFLFSNQFLGIDKVFIIHLMALPSVFLGYLFSKIFIIENKSFLNLISSTSIAVINVLLNLIFIPRYGALGAAAATSISYFFRIVISMFNSITFKIIINNYKHLIFTFIPIFLSYFYVLGIYKREIYITSILISITFIP